MGNTATHIALDLHAHTNACTDEKCYCFQCWKKSKWRGWVSSEVHPPLVTPSSVPVAYPSLLPTIPPSLFPHSPSFAQASSLCSPVNKRAALPALALKALTHTRLSRLRTLPHALAPLCKTSPLLRTNLPFISFVFPFTFSLSAWLSTSVNFLPYISKPLSCYSKLADGEIYCLFKKKKNALIFSSFPPIFFHRLLFFSPLFVFVGGFWCVVSVSPHTLITVQQ